jgi:hypothetical protein
VGFKKKGIDLTVFYPVLENDDRFRQFPVMFYFKHDFPVVAHHLFQCIPDEKPGWDQQKIAE